MGSGLRVASFLYEETHGTLFKSALKVHSHETILLLLARQAINICTLPQI